jgi:hypothetical protein
MMWDQKGFIAQAYINCAGNQGPNDQETCTPRLAMPVYTVYRELPMFCWC